MRELEDCDIINYIGTPLKFFLYNHKYDNLIFVDYDEEVRLIQKSEKIGKSDGGRREMILSARESSSNCLLTNEESENFERMGVCNSFGKTMDESYQFHEYEGTRGFGSIIGVGFLDDDTLCVVAAEESYTRRGCQERVIKVSIYNLTGIEQDTYNIDRLNSNLDSEHVKTSIITPFYMMSFDVPFACHSSAICEEPSHSLIAVAGTNGIAVLDLEDESPSHVAPGNEIRGTPLQILRIPRDARETSSLRTTECPHFITRLKFIGLGSTMQSTSLRNRTMSSHVLVAGMRNGVCLIWNWCPRFNSFKLMSFLSPGKSPLPAVINFSFSKFEENGEGGINSTLNAEKQRGVNELVEVIEMTLFVFHGFEELIIRDKAGGHSVLPPSFAVADVLWNFRKDKPVGIPGVISHMVLWRVNTTVEFGEIREMTVGTIKEISLLVIFPRGPFVSHISTIPCTRTNSESSEDVIYAMFIDKWGFSYIHGFDCYMDVIEFLTWVSQNEKSKHTQLCERESINTKSVPWSPRLIDMIPVSFCGDVYRTSQLTLVMCSKPDGTLWEIPLTCHSHPLSEVCTYSYLVFLVVSL